MENAVVPVLNLFILGAFFVAALRELSQTKTVPIQVKDRRSDR